MTVQLIFPYNAIYKFGVEPYHPWIVSILMQTILRTPIYLYLAESINYYMPTPSTAAPRLYISWHFLPSSVRIPSAEWRVAAQRLISFSSMVIEDVRPPSPLSYFHSTPPPPDSPCPLPTPFPALLDLEIEIH